MHAPEAVESANAWRKYTRQISLGGMQLDLVPLEDHHKQAIEQFQDRLDAQTVYLRHGSYVSASLRKSPAWLETQLNKEAQDGFSQGAFLNGTLVGIGSIHKIAGETAAEAALVVSREFQGLGRGGEKGVGGLLLEDLVRYARDQQLQRVTAYVPVRNPRCEKLLRKYGAEISHPSHPGQEGSAVLDLRRG